MKNLKRILIFILILTMLNISQVFAEFKYTETEVKGDYEYVNLFSEGLAVVEKNKKYGYINEEGKEVIPCIYDWAEDFLEGLAIVKRDGKYGYINKEGIEVIPCIYDYAYDFSEGLALVRKDDKWGYIDKEGKEIIPFIYDYEETDMKVEFSEGLLTVWRDGKGGYVNRKGEEVIPCIYDNVYDFSEGLALVSKDDKYAYINKEGKEVIPCIYSYAYSFSEGLALVAKGKYPDEKWGYIDKEGNEVIPCIYDAGWDFSGGLACVWKDGRRIIYIDKNGNEVITIPSIYNYAYAVSEKIIAVVTSLDKIGFINRNGEKVTECIYTVWDNIPYSISEGLIRVEKDWKYGYIDEEGEEVIPCIYDYSYDFSEGLVAVEKDNKWGYIDKEGNEVIPCIYDNFAYDFRKDLSRVKKDGRYYILKLDQPYTNVSGWAEGEMNKAEEENLIPDMLMYTDFTKNITREEFAAVTVKLYEKLTGKKAEVVANPFEDTANEEVLKAYGLGITNGISANEFAPEELITREQMATMMARAMEKAGKKVNIAEQEKFADDEEISSWAKESVYYMSGIGIIKGIGENKFGSKQNATREQSLAISVRSI